MHVLLYGRDIFDEVKRERTTRFEFHSSTFCQCFAFKSIQHYTVDNYMAHTCCCKEFFSYCSSNPSTQSLRIRVFNSFYQWSGITVAVCRTGCVFNTLNSASDKYSRETFHFPPTLFFSTKLAYICLFSSFHQFVLLLISPFFLSF